MKSFTKGFLIALGIVLPVGLIVLIIWNLKNPSSKVPEETAKIEYTEETDSSLFDIIEEIRNTASQTPEEPVEEAEEEPQSITLLFAGDLLFNNNSLSAYYSNGVSALFDENLLSEMTSADFFMLNEEFPFSNQGTAADKEWTFRIDPKHAPILHELGIDCVTIANNHAFDYGAAAFVDTIDTLDGIEMPHVGGGRNLEEAMAPYVVEIGDKTIGFLGASRVIPDGSWAAGKSHAGMFTTYDPKPLMQSITKLKESCDYVGVFVHWGVEKDTIPQEYQRTMARNFIDSGADIVIGSHPHVLQGFEYYKDKPIAYSLGNYLFSNNANPTVLYKLVIDPDGTVTPSVIAVTRSGVQMIMRENQSAAYRDLTSISFGVEIAEDGIIKQK